MDTIFAVSSGKPPAAIAVIRISGPHAIMAATALAGRLPLARRAALRMLRDTHGGLLDHALAIVFPGPNTATGEDLVEFHCHGGRAVVSAVERALGAINGCRLARPGEFTRRALANGRIDLAEAEGLADLLEAETERQRIAALSAVEGQVSRSIGLWLERIAMLSAEIETMLDFSDEGEIVEDADQLSSIRRRAGELANDIGRVVDAPPVERIRDGISVVLGGPPNSGKSTLINLLAQRDAAIVSSIAGTTRDRIDVPVSRAGIAYLLSDTAGITDTKDHVEAIGVERATAASRSADILLWLGDDEPPRADALLVHARTDVTGRSVPPTDRVAVSQYDGASIERLWQAIADRSASLLPAADQLPLKQWQRVCCATTISHLIDLPDDVLLIGEHLRQARVQLAEVTGVNATEVMLDTLFGRFCIGK